MHPSAMQNCKMFFDTYTENLPRTSSIIEIGSQDINGSLKDVAPAHLSYLGVDFAKGKGVDIVLDDPYKLPFDDSSVDIVLSSSCFEHSEMFWVLFLEILRVLKPTGLFYLNAPSNGMFHRFPVDCWRFYPDSGNALVRWAKRNSIDAALLESYTSAQRNDMWNDFVAVFVKSEAHVANHPNRILHKFTNFQNGIIHGHPNFLKVSTIPEDQKKFLSMNQSRKQ